MNKKGKIDYILLSYIVMLIGISISIMYSASIYVGQRLFNDGLYFLNRQLLSLLVAVPVLIAASFVNLKIFKKSAEILIYISIALLALVLIPGIGREIGGAKRWIWISSFIHFQPSEITKTFLVLFLAAVFSRIRARTLKTYLYPAGIVAVIFLLVIFQPDFSTSFSLIISAVILFYVSGIPIKYLLVSFLGMVPLLAGFVLAKPYRAERFIAFLNPYANPKGIGYQIIQSLIAFSNGGFWGTGIGLGRQKIFRIPEPHTDFIFSIIGEEFGFIGTLAVLILFMLILTRAHQIIKRANNSFSYYAAIGMTVLIVQQAVVNMGVALGLLPITGMTLPFISFGGTSLIIMMFNAGILLNISRQSSVSSASENSSTISTGSVPAQIKPFINAGELYQ